MLPDRDAHPAARAGPVKDENRLHEVRSRALQRRRSFRSCAPTHTLIPLPPPPRSAGANHSLAIAEDGSLWTCGRGRNGQLGHGGFTDEAPLQCVDALKGTRIVSTAAGVAHSVALASDGTLFTWGDGRYGQLGHPALETLQYAVENIALAKPWKLATLEPRMLKPHERVTAVSAGGYHTLAVTVGGELKVWGRNDRGQLGLGGRKLRSQSQPYKKAVWTPTSAVITDVSAPRCSDVRVVQAVAGYSHSLILLHCNGVPAVLSTGSNFFGQLGHGDTLSRNEFTRINALSGQNIMSLSSGDYHCAAIGPEGGLYVWGRGDSGQLGITSKKSSWTPRRLPGLNVVHPDRTLRRKGGNTCKVPHRSAKRLSRSAWARSRVHGCRSRTRPPTALPRCPADPEIADGD